MCIDNGITPDCDATVTGTVVDDNEDPLAGVAVEVVDGEATSTDLSGAFSLTAPMGEEVLFRHGDATGYWGEVETTTFTPPDLDLGTKYLPSDDAVSDELGGVPGVDPIDPGKGIVIVSFDDASESGGESAGLSLSSEPSFTQNDQGVFEVSPALLDNGGGELIFVNVDPGDATITVQGSSGVNTCVLASPSITDWPVVAHTITFVEAVCAPL